MESQQLTFIEIAIAYMQMKFTVYVSGVRLIYTHFLTPLIYVVIWRKFLLVKSNPNPKSVEILHEILRLR